ncbi:hypothetical protein [Ectothiorhodospira variabilis]|uniref:hypothetical protein n=1 Tax=Ectothiorhodospira variabilis TaxID=505694 RepID=UPI001EFB3A3F|nr:hypothetical protein [Ectothiorhodospira variabilis]MCG5497557.1 hypothetical protein [Ectothiorhodospira variabilis]
MVESFLEEGNQPMAEDRSKLRYGCSITDACVNWATTEEMIREGARVLRQVRKQA